ncbi:MAG: RagB/SusD family nutrient uptake outer membrane protein [Bacteroides sp.]|nr:RagB/SusD family nutrient uptake outer membrane protein [Bacteroides sp.]
MINRYILKSIGIAVLSCSVMSCNDVLDVNDEANLSDQAVWSNETAADMYITATYKTFTEDAIFYGDGGDRSHFWDSFSDIMKSSSWDQYAHPYNSTLLQGNIVADYGAGAFECWNSVYDRIRQDNIRLRDLYTYGTGFSAEWVALRDAEIRLCRAYNYFKLARVYGGVVLRTDKTGVTGVDDGAYPQDIVRPRITEAETYRFILDELQAAAEVLPKETSDSWQRGRATKALAYGLISRIALYAKEWKEAAEAAEKCGALDAVDLNADYASLFTSASIGTPEMIFQIEFQKGAITHLFDVHNAPGGDFNISNQKTYAEHQPTAELADIYEWSDGTPFNWNTWSAEGHADPYTDREPRFQATVLYNGAPWRDRFIESYADYTDINDNKVSSYDGFTEFVKTGSTGGKSCTGYFLRKFVDEANKDFTTDKSTTPCPIIRYGEVLLNQAEAYAQSDVIGNQQKILDCINRLRKRVNLPEKTVQDVKDLETAMSLIRSERIKELAGEGFRFWDIRRWRLGQAILDGKTRHGVKIVNNQRDSSLAPEFTYEVCDVDANTPIIFPERYYLFSIPISERNNNPACTNNPLW